MSEKFPKRTPNIQKVARAALLGATLAGPVAASGSYAIDRGVDIYLEKYGLSEEAIARYLEELKAKLAAIKAKQAVKHRFVEMTERLAESIRTGRLIRDDEFVIESQIKALEAVETIQSISYWVGLLSLWGSLTALLTGVLYRKQKFDEVHEQTAYLNEKLDEQKELLEKIPKILAGIIAVLEAEAQKENPDAISPSAQEELLEVKKLLEETFGVKTEGLLTRLNLKNNPSE